MALTSEKVTVLNIAIIIQCTMEIATFEGALALALFSTINACVLPIHIKKIKTELEQYQALQRNGVLTPATITFSGNNTRQDDMILAEAEIRYIVDVEEVVKMTETTRSNKSAEGTVETVEVLVLPGHSKSGVEPSHAKNEIDRIEKAMFRAQWCLLMYLVLAVATWPWAIHKAREEQQMYVVYILLVFAAVIVLFAIATIAQKLKPMSKHTCLFFGSMIVSGHAILIQWILKQDISFWCFLPMFLFGAWLLYGIARYLRPGQRDILDPIDNVTVSFVGKSDQDPAGYPVSVALETQALLDKV